ncbi:hypothetical protein G7Z17_g816 [Cylindrodendrum hubeiense]|uniref:Apple domain-containing protein n=1 Tax=Cylindrodendrum hubeiense TaxID=595255 RepID=A0A9P5HG55_9HYPO|nr:hypothetical protein G7Z17_g816 [Cylindrodendrum hubeiense]
MVSIKLIATLAVAFTLGGVQATPLAPVARGVTCGAVDAPTDSLTCGSAGYVINNAAELRSQTTSTIEDCASACYDLGPCYVFTYNDSGFCQLFLGVIKDMNDFQFTDITPETKYYDVDCFSCS